MSVEVTYPVHESIVGGFLTTFYNLVAIVFLLLFFIPKYDIIIILKFDSTFPQHWLHLDKLHPGSGHSPHDPRHAAHPGDVQQEQRRRGRLVSKLLVQNYMCRYI